MKIRNINEKYGEPVEFEGENLYECIYDFVCGLIFAGYDDGTMDVDTIREGVDYEIIKEEEGK